MRSSAPSSPAWRWSDKCHVQKSFPSSVFRRSNELLLRHIVMKRVPVQINQAIIQWSFLPSPAWNVNPSMFLMTSTVGWINCDPFKARLCVVCFSFDFQMCQICISLILVLEAAVVSPSAPHQWCSNNESVYMTTTIPLADQMSNPDILVPR